MKFTLMVEGRMHNGIQCFFDGNLPENHPFGCCPFPKILINFYFVNS